MMGGLRQVEQNNQSNLIQFDSVCLRDPYSFPGVVGALKYFSGNLCITMVQIYKKTSLG